MNTSPELVVAVNGKDSWSGHLPEPNAEGTDGPLASIYGACQRIRSMKTGIGHKSVPLIPGQLPVPLRVRIRGGRYPIREPIVFTPEDSVPVTFSAYANETPVIDGGEKIDGWRTETVNGRTAWVTDLPEVAQGAWFFRSLFVNGERRQRPRMPKKGLFRMAEAPDMTLPRGWNRGGQTRFVARRGDAALFKNLNDVEVVYVHFWIEERSPIAAYDPETGMVTMSRPSRSALVGSHGSQLADYYFDNVYEALTEPGEWYLDRATGRLTYLPLPGEVPETTEVFAPRCLQLLALKGDPERERFVEFLRFENLCFQHTDWRHPDPSDEQADFIGSNLPPGNERRRHFRGNHAAANQAACDVPGAIFMEAARYCAFENCEIRNIGWYGMEISDGCRGIRAVGNTLYDMGGGGIKINGANYGEPPARQTGNILVSDNTIRTGGRIFHSAVGVLAMYVHHVAIRHNHIHDLFYSGISCGWTWGYADSITRDNRIEYNHIHDLGQGLLSDMGGIYTLGVQPGTVIRGNLIHDIEKAHYGAWCIYPDEGSSHILIEKNICFRTNGEIFHQHYGRENIVRNNIFAFCETALLKLSRAEETHKSFSMTRNILLVNDRPVFAAGYDAKKKELKQNFDMNVMYDLSGKAPVFLPGNRRPPMTLEEWRGLGNDCLSITTDPKLKDPAAGDFTPAPDSPAWKQGFEPIDLSTVGPRPCDQRSD